MDAPLRIALVCETDAIGGAETMLHHLGVSLRERGHWVCFVGPAGGGPLSTRFADDGFVTHTFTLRRAIDPASVRALAALFRRERIDVVNSHMFTSIVYGTAAARRAHTAHVATMHGTGRETSALRRRLALRWAFARSQGAIAVSSALRDELRTLLGTVAARMRVVANGVPPVAGSRAVVRGELGIRDDELLVVAIGNLFQNKGHQLLLDALEPLAPAIPWRVAIAGREEDAAPALRASIAERGWGARAHLLGPRGDIANILAAADIYAMPSLREALPMALLEAMMAGVPIVASAVGGIPDVARHEQEALLVPPGDSAALGAMIARLAANETLRSRLAGAARARVERDFGVETMTAAYEAVYHDAVHALSPVRRRPGGLLASSDARDAGPRVNTPAPL